MRKTAPLRTGNTVSVARCAGAGTVGCGGRGAFVTAQATPFATWFDLFSCNDDMPNHNLLHWRKCTKVQIHTQAYNTKYNNYKLRM